MQAIVNCRPKNSRNQIFGVLFSQQHWWAIFNRELDFLGNYQAHEKSCLSHRAPELRALMTAAQYCDGDNGGDHEDQAVADEGDDDEDCVMLEQR